MICTAYCDRIKHYRTLFRSQSSTTTYFGKDHNVNA